MKEEKNDKAKLQNMQQGQQPVTGQDIKNSSSAKQGHAAEEELLTTGGPVDRSAVDDSADTGVINANTGMSIQDEESNFGKEELLQKPTKGRSARYGHPEKGIYSVSGHLYEEDQDTSQDKTEGIINPRTTQDAWAKFKGYSEEAGEEDSSSQR